MKNEEETLQLLKESIQNPAKKKEERAKLIHGFFEKNEEIMFPQI